MQTISEKTLKDIDVYGRNNLRGGGLIHTGDFAISNAIVLYLGSDENDYIYKPGKGAGLRRFVFKGLTQYNSDRIQKFIYSGLNSRFGKLIEQIQVLVTPNFENRYQEIEIFWVSIRTKKSNSVKFYSKIPDNLIPNQIILRDNYQNRIKIDFTGDNLIAFITLKQSEVNPTERLQFDSKESQWYWGPYIFTNLTESSEEFEDIKQITGIIG